MREAKKVKSSPTGAGSGSESLTGASPSPLNNRQSPRTPKSQEMAILSAAAADKEPPVSWQPATPNGQVPTSTRVKNESSEDLMGSMKPSPATSLGMVPSSPLDQFKKEDPIEKMAQMSSSIGGGNSFLNLRSPSSAPTTPASMGPHSQQHIPPQSPGGMMMLQQQQLPVGNMGSRVAAPSPHMMMQQQQAPLHHPHHLNSISPSGHNSLGNTSMNAGVLNAQMMHPAAVQQQQNPQQIPPQPYMQPESAVFVFSTELANAAADAVASRQFPTIIHYHCHKETTRDMLNRLGIPVGPDGIPPMCQPRGPVGMMTQPGQRGQHFHHHPAAAPRNMYAQNGPVMMNSPPMDGGLSDMHMTGGGGGGMQNMDKAHKLAKIRAMQETMGFGPESEVAPPPPYPMQPMPPQHQPRTPVRARNPSKRDLAAMRARQQQQQNDMSQELILPSDFDSMIKAEKSSSPNFSSSDPFLQGKVRDTGVTSVMPVPSPQPIQYLNPVDAQEVVIHKQPNKNYRQSGMMGGGGPGGVRGMTPRMRPPMSQQQLQQGPPMDQMNMGYNEAMYAQRMPGGMMSPPINHMQPPPHQMQQQQYSQQQQPQQFAQPPFPSQMGEPPGMQNSMSPRLRAPSHPGMGPGPQAVYNSNPNFDPNFRHQFPPHNGPPGSQHAQTVNNTYISAQLTVEQVNIQQHQTPLDSAQYTQSQTTLNYSAECPQPNYETQSSPNIMIKPGAPNTIQYLPRQPPPPKQARGPPNLDFIQQWTRAQGQNNNNTNNNNGQFYHNANQSPQFCGDNGQMMNYGGPPPSLPQMDGGPPNNSQYAAQYHQFQQSLYASNVTNNNNNNNGNNQQVNSTTPTSSSTPVATPLQ